LLALALQIGLVQWHNFAGADCGGGPNAHLVNGKDHGGIFEMTWVVDARSRTKTATRDMSGIFNALAVAKSAQGDLPGVADEIEWPSPRGRRGVITQSAPFGDPSHSGMLAVDRMRFVGYGQDQPAVALEHCAKCKRDQGGFHTYTSNLTFVQSGCVTASRCGCHHFAINRGLLVQLNSLCQQVTMSLT
jgi:hypothetical protein